MTHVKILAVALIAALALGGAGPASAQSDCPTASDIAGTWRWVESRLGGDTVITPESESPASQSLRPDRGRCLRGARKRPF